MARPMPVLPAVPSTIRPPGLQLAAPLGVADDPQRRAVLHRLAGVQELGLAEDLAAGGLAGGLQADERRVADEVQHGARDHGFVIAGWNGARKGEDGCSAAVAGVSDGGSPARPDRWSH